MTDKYELDDKPAIFKIDKSDYKDDAAYTRDIIRHVRKAHQVDDRLENARRETISRNFTTSNVWPKALSTPLVKDPVAKSFQDHYYVKAMVPICKTVYETEFCQAQMTQKPAFKKVGEPALLNDQIIFGVLTAKEHAG